MAEDTAAASGLCSGMETSEILGGRLDLRLRPQGHLVCEAADDASVMDEAVAARIAAAFAGGSGPGLLQLGASEVGQALPPAFVWWRGFACRYVAALCQHGAGAVETEAAVVPEVPAPGEGELVSLVLTAPMMAGAEYLTADVLRALWIELGQAVAASLAKAGTDLQAFLKRLNPAWNLVGRVHFNLAENRRDPDAPFAFMATYTTQLSAQARAQHLPLGQALREYAGAANRRKLLSLLLPVQRAAERCAWLRPMVEAGEIFHPLRWSPREASRFLASAAELESAGVVVRMPTSLACQPPTAPAGDGNGRHPRPLEARTGWAAGFRRRNDARRRALERTGDPRAARRHRRTGPAARPMGRGGSRTAGTHHATVPGGGGAGARSRG